MASTSAIGLTLNETPWAIFSTGSGGTHLRADQQRLDVDRYPTLWQLAGLSAPVPDHMVAGSVVYAIDGTVVATHAIAIGGTMRPLVSDLTPGANTALSVDWIQLTPYASSGSFNVPSIRRGLVDDVGQRLVVGECSNGNDARRQCPVR